MNLRSRQGVVTTVFIIMSAAFLFSIAYSAINYVRFFPALALLQPHVDRVVVGKDPASSSTVLSARVIIANPTDYNGLKIATLQIRAYFIHSSENISIFREQPLIVFKNIDHALAPQSEMVQDLVFSLEPEQASSLEAFHNEYYGEIIAHTTATVQVVTFLNPVTGRVILDKIEDIPLS